MRDATSRRAGNHVLVARLALPECASALAGRRRAGDIKAPRVARVMAVLQSDLSGRYSVVELTQEVLDLAARLALTHPIRAADAIHLAAACLAQATARTTPRTALRFVTSDQRLRRAAESERFEVIDPAIATAL